MLKIAGAMTAMVTPFRDGKIDESRLRDQIEYQIRNGIDGLVPVGTTGESPTLDFPEHERVIQITVTIANRRVPVIAGVGGNATTEALELHRFAKEVGCDAGLSVNPYYNKPTQEGLYRHFMTLADNIDLPIVLYNIPGRTGVTMSAQSGNFTDAAAIHRRLFPLIKSLFLDGNPVGIKYAMQVAGRDTGEMRLPLWEASDETKKTIEQLVREQL